jgi:hypothetical protein
MSSIPEPVKKALTVLAGACDDLSRVIRELPEAAAPVAEAEAEAGAGAAEPVAALGAAEPVEGAAQGPAQEVEGAQAAQKVEEAGEGAGAQAGAAQGPAQEVEGAGQDQVPEAGQDQVPEAAQVPDAAQPDAAQGPALGNDTVIQVDGNNFVYGKIMQSFETTKKGETKLSKEKLDEVYEKLKNARTTVEVQNILREHNFAMAGKGANKYVQQLSGGTRKPRMHRRKKTQRKRSKTIKKKPKSGNRK